MLEDMAVFRIQILYVYVAFYFPIEVFYFDFANNHQ